MKLKLITLLSIIYYLLSIPSLVEAIELPGTTPGQKITIEQPECKNGSGLLCEDELSLALIINKSIPLLFTIAGLILFVYFLWGGFKFLTSLGDEQAVSEAKGMLTNAIVGFVAVFAAYWITVLFTKLFGIPIF